MRLRGQTMRLYPVVHHRALGWVGPLTPPTCPTGQFWDGTQCRASVGTIPGAAGVTNPAPGAAPAPAPAPTPAPTPQPGAGTSPAGAAPQQNLIACINGPDLYDIYNPGMVLVAKGVLNPAASYPSAHIDFPNFPPCPVPQATGVGGSCDIPGQYLAPKGGGPGGREVLACYTDRGVTLIDYATGEPIGTHFNGACISLLSSVTIAQAGDPRCGGPAAAAGAAPTPTPTPTPTPPTNATPPTAPPVTTPPSNITSAAAASGSIPTQPIMAPQAPGASPWPGYGSPIGMAPPGYGGGIPAQPMPASALMPPSQPMACENALKPKTLEQWIEDCPGVKKARGY